MKNSNPATKPRFAMDLYVLWGALSFMSVKLPVELIDLTKQGDLKNATAVMMIAIFSFAVFAFCVLKMVRASARENSSKARDWAEALVILPVSFLHVGLALSVAVSPLLKRIPKWIPSVDFGEGLGLGIVFVILPSILASLGVYYIAMRLKTSGLAKATP